MPRYAILNRKNVVIDFTDDFNEAKVKANLALFNRAIQLSGDEQTSTPLGKKFSELEARMKSYYLNTGSEIF